MGLILGEWVGVGGIDAGGVGGIDAVEGGGQIGVL